VPIAAAAETETRASMPRFLNEKERGKPMMKEDFNRVNASSMISIRPKYKGKTTPLCNRSKSGAGILCDQANVSKCEAELFCNAVHRLNCELCKAQTLCELKQVFEMINCLLTSSAAKELSLAEIIKATNLEKPKADQACNC